MISEVHEKKVFHSKHVAPDFENEDVSQSREDVARVKISKCNNCKYNNLCEGYWKEYVKFLNIK